MPSERYPEAGSLFRAGLTQRVQRFVDAREHFLLDYGYNTARAYWGDLDEIYRWCEKRGFDIFDLTDEQFRQYKALMKRRRYSQSTIRRRGVALRGFRRAINTESTQTPERFVSSSDS